jgi:hypothetical protein
MARNPIIREPASKVPAPTDETPHGCYEGVVYLGHLIEEDGEEVEVIEAIPCRRCKGDELSPLSAKGF